MNVTRIVVFGFGIFINESRRFLRKTKRIDIYFISLVPCKKLAS